MYAVIAAAETSSVNAVRADGSFTPSVFPLATRLSRGTVLPYSFVLLRSCGPSPRQLRSGAKGADANGPLARSLGFPWTRNRGITVMSNGATQARSVRRGARGHLGLAGRRRDTRYADAHGRRR